LGKSFYRLLHVETGIEPEHVVTLRLGAYGPLYEKDEQRVGLLRQVVEHMRALPGVAQAGVANQLPLGSGDGIQVFSVTGRADDGIRHEANLRMVGPSY